jgi:tRNA threonylcarbamoyladenosine biosynthesis protein TsaE
MAGHTTGLDKVKEIFCDSPGAMDAVAKKIIDFAGGLKVWSFEGEMGAGKTTLIKAICQILGVIDTVSSPTYSLVNEYASGPSNTIFHFDFYRINSESEALDLGFEDYLGSDQLCLIEWPSKVPSLLPDTRLNILIEVINANARKIIVSGCI